MTLILGIDPGLRSGFCFYDTDGRRVDHRGQFDADDYSTAGLNFEFVDIIVIERPRGFGFNTRPQMVECGIIFGRIAERLDHEGRDVQEMDRLEVCKTLSAALHGRINVRNDATAWACLKELHGGEACVKKQGALHGVKAHERAALAVAVAFALKQAKAAEVAS